MNYNNKMINKIVCVLFLFLFSVCYGQGANNVRKNHTKKLIYTLKPGESFPHNESKMMVNNKGVDIEFYISNKHNKWTYYKNGTVKYDVPYLFRSGYLFNEPVIVVNGYVNKTKMQSILLKDGKKIGPFKKVFPIVVVENLISTLKGYIVTDNSGEKYVEFNTNTTYGPFSSIKEIKYSNLGVVIAYQNKQQHYVLLNGKSYGPYLDTKLTYDYKILPQIDHFWFKDSSSLQNDFWKLNIRNQIIEGEFKRVVNIEYFENETFNFSGLEYVNGHLQKWIVSNNVKYYDVNDRIFQFTNNLGKVLTLEKKGEPFDYKSKYISYLDNVLQAEVKKSIVYKCRTTNSSYFPVVYEDSVDQNLLYIPGVNKQITIFNKKEIRGFEITIYNDDYLYITKKDSTLFINGKETQFKHVLYTYPTFDNEYIIVTNEGNHYNFICNDKILSLDELKAKSLHIDYNFHIDNRANIQVEYPQQYILTNKGKNKFGPFEYNEFKKCEATKDGLHYAYHNFNKNQIVIDGKIIGDGNNLIYNETLNAFQWLEIDNNSLIQHTYMLN